MKKIFNFSLLIPMFVGALLTTATATAQADKSQRPSPPAVASETTKDGVTIKIDYSQPSVKGRTIGKEIAPFGKVWRTGANEATAFEVSEDVTIEGKPLAKGKYGLYSIPGETEWTIIFNKTWNQWGLKYTEADDALRITVPMKTSTTPYEKMTFSISKGGLVTLWWGDKTVAFSVKKA